MEQAGISPGRLPRNWGNCQEAQVGDVPLEKLASQIVADRGDELYVEALV